MFNSPVLVFDIETVPDADSGRTTLGLGGIDDHDVARAMAHRRRQKTGGSDFLALHYHRIVAIAVALKEGDGFRVWSLGDKDSTEKELLERFSVELRDTTQPLYPGMVRDLISLLYIIVRCITVSSQNVTGKTAIPTENSDGITMQIDITGVILILWMFCRDSRPERLHLWTRFRNF